MVGYYVVGGWERVYFAVDVLSLVVVKRNYETGATVKVARVLAVIYVLVLNESKIGSLLVIGGAKKVTDHHNNDHTACAITT